MITPRVSSGHSRCPVHARGKTALLSHLIVTVGGCPRKYLKNQKSDYKLRSTKGMGMVSSFARTYSSKVVFHEQNKRHTQNCIETKTTEQDIPSVDRNRYKGPDKCINREGITPGVSTVPAARDLGILST
jgi:hypothetical protein